jgi:23S rRNA (cytosine1962-C5)-methyltransferase
MPYAELHLKAGRERSVYFRHPWIFSGALKKTPTLPDGSIVQVFEDSGKPLGLGFFSPKNQISCRMFYWGIESPDVDIAFFKERIKLALSLRKPVISQNTDCYRLIHAEGDLLPGIIADVYGPVVVLQLLIAGTEQLLEPIVSAIYAHGFEHIYLKAKTSSQQMEDIRTPSSWLKGGVEGVVRVMENGIPFEIDFINGQKTGFFLDQRDNRALLHHYAKDKTVLNTFCYTGGFSAYAIAGGAKEVVSVDISKEAVAQCNHNMTLLNAPTPHQGVTADCFDYLGDIPDQHYDIIVLDPPAFAKNARAVENAARGYKQINLKAFRKVKSGGLVFTFSCSQNIDKDLFRKIVFGAAADARRDVRILHQLQQPADHPVNIYHPEGEYLKGLVLWVD